MTFFDIYHEASVDLQFIGFDPAPTLEKILEMVLYLAVGLLTGTLVARINAILKRTRNQAAPQEVETIRVDKLEIDIAEQRATWGGGENPG